MADRPEIGLAFSEGILSGQSNMVIAIDTLLLSKQFRYTGTGVYLFHVLSECLRIAGITTPSVEFHSAIITGPMLVFGPGKYRERFPEYLGILLRGHFALMVPGAALLAAAAFLLGWLYSPAVERALLALAIAGPFILLLWLLRRAFYVRLNPGWAAAGGGVYLLVLLASALTLRAAGHLTPAMGFLAMAAASLITCLILFVLMGSVRRERSITRI